MSDSSPPADERPPPFSAASPKEQSRAMAEAVIGSFLDRLTAEAERRGGSLNVNDIRAIGHEFEKKTEALQAVFETSFEAYVRIRERAVWNQARQYPFDRLIVKKFEPLFPGTGGVDLRDGGLSRRILPGFFLAMNLMLGDDVIEDYQARCRAIIERLQEKSGDAFNWDDAYDDPEADRVTLDSVAAMASYFGDLEKRTAWFLGIINDNLAPPNTAREGEDSATWQFTEEGFHHFLAALFADVRQTMTTEGGRLAITKSHGGEACAALWDILEKLEAVGAGGELE